MTDLELITRVKVDNDSDAIKELITRHTGIYLDMVTKHAAHAQLPVNDIRDDKAFNIYQFALKYDPTRDTQFSTYVADRTKWMCLNLNNRAPKSLTFDENIAPSNENAVTENVNRHDDMAVLRERAKRVDDPKFYRIFCLRFNGDKVRSWRAIGRKMHMTHEGARKLFERHAHKLRSWVTT